MIRRFCSYPPLLVALLSILIPGNRAVAYAEQAARAAAEPAKPLGSASDFNLFVLGDLQQSGTQTKGRLAVGGNATLANYGVGAALANSRGSRDDLIVGGRLRFSNGWVTDGNVVSEGEATLANVRIPHGRYQQYQALDFSAEQAYLQQAAAEWSQLAPNGTATLEYRKNSGARISLAGTDAGLNVFALSSQDLAAAGTLVIAAPAGSTVLVNIAGATNQLKDLGFLITGTDRQHLLFNFFETTTLTLADDRIQGSILAPYAAITFAAGRINGTLIGASLTGAGAAHHHPFIGELPAVAVA